MMSGAVLRIVPTSFDNAAGSHGGQSFNPKIGNVSTSSHRISDADSPNSLLGFPAPQYDIPSGIDQSMPHALCHQAIRSPLRRPAFCEPSHIQGESRMQSDRLPPRIHFQRQRPIGLILDCLFRFYRRIPPPSGRARGKIALLQQFKTPVITNFLQDMPHERIE